MAKRNQFLTWFALLRQPNATLIPAYFLYFLVAITSIQAFASPLTKPLSVADTTTLPKESEAGSVVAMKVRLIGKAKSISNLVCAAPATKRDADNHGHLEFLLLV